MISWKPKIPDPFNLDRPQSKQYYQKRIFCLIGVAVLGIALAFYLPSNSIIAIISIIITALLFLGLYLRWRKFFFSYWCSNNTDRFYYEDYSWKDSLSITLILITGLGLLGFILFYIAARVDFTKIKPLAVLLQKII